MSQTTRRPGAANRRRTGPSAWLAAPAMLFFGLFALVPLVGAFYFSFMKWDGLGPMTYAGTTNWEFIFSDSRTVHAMWLSLEVMVLSWLLQAPISLLLGVFMAGRQRYREVMAVFFFLPLLFSSAAIGVGFKQMIDPNFGLASHLPLDFLRQDWLGADLALWFVLLTITWAFVPFHSLIYQAGVRQIPVALYEAAMIDGASAWTRFWRITIPQLKYTIVTSSTLILVGALTYFDLFYVMTQGCPGNVTRILPLDMYLTGFRAFNMGRASAIATVLVVVGLTLSLTLNKLSGAQRMESQQEGI